MLTKAQKQKISEDLAEKFKKQKIAIFSNFHGISVSKAQTLRRALKQTDAEYKVAKKTILDRVMTEQDIPFKTKGLQGEVSVTFGYGDQVAPAKTLLKFRKENETFKILGGILEGKMLSGNDIMTLARLPAREILLAQVVGVMQAPIRGLVMALQGNIRNLATVLSRVRDNK